MNPDLDGEIVSAKQFNEADRPDPSGWHLVSSLVAVTTGEISRTHRAFQPWADLLRRWSRQPGPVLMICPDCGEPSLLPKGSSLCVRCRAAKRVVWHKVAQWPENVAPGRTWGRYMPWWKAVGDGSS